MIFVFTLFNLFAFEEPRWWDYPGFELWKFVNLAVFAFVLILAMRKFFRVPEMFKDRKETIKRELARWVEEGRIRPLPMSFRSLAQASGSSVRG